MRKVWGGVRKGKIVAPDRGAWLTNVGRRTRMMIRQGRAVGYPRDMSEQAKIVVQLLMQLRSKYGDLNVAFVCEYVRGFGPAPVAKIADELKINRTVVRRALRSMSQRDTEV